MPSRDSNWRCRVEPCLLKLWRSGLFQKYVIMIRLVEDASTPAIFTLLGIEQI